MTGGGREQKQRSCQANQKGPLHFSKGASNHGKGPVPTNFAEHIANGEQRVYIACLPGGHPHPALSARRIMVIRRVSMAQPALRVVEGASMDKSKALDAALSQIERAFG